MKWLAVDTSGPSLSVALGGDGGIIFECVQQNGLTHSESLMPLVDTALTAGGLAAADVDAFIAVTGPGSFTGVRIGVATIKALAHAAKKPCAGVNALELLAMACAYADGIVCPLRDARAGQVYAAAFRNGARALDDAAMRLEDFLARVTPLGDCLFVGDGAAAYRDVLEEHGRIAPENLHAPRASSAILWAMSNPQAFGHWSALNPYYLRKPQAEREREARLGAAKP